MPGGRPTEYNEEFVTEVVRYLESCVDENVQEITGESEKFTSYKNKLKVRLPTIEGLARYLKVHKDTIYEWEKIHQEFSDVIGDLRMQQAESLINNGLSGDYNSTIAKVLLTKHGYADKTEVDQRSIIKDDRLDESKITADDLRTLIAIRRKYSSDTTGQD